MAAEGKFPYLIMLQLSVHHALAITHPRHLHGDAKLDHFLIIWLLSIIQSGICFCSHANVQSLGPDPHRCISRLVVYRFPCNIVQSEPRRYSADIHYRSPRRRCFFPSLSHSAASSASSTPSNSPSNSASSSRSASSSSRFSSCTMSIRC